VSVANFMKEEFTKKCWQWQEPLLSCTWNVHWWRVWSTCWFMGFRSAYFQISI